jgi:hypothetical protein
MFAGRTGIGRGSGRFDAGTDGGKAPIFAQVADGFSRVGFRPFQRRKIVFWKRRNGARRAN